MSSCAAEASRAAACVDARAELAEVLIAVLEESAAKNATFDIANDPARPPGAWHAGLRRLRADPLPSE